MKIEQIYTGCLAQGAYYIESQGEVAIIDPLREVQHYLDKATADGAKIKYIFETHFHADFVSGHVTLAQKTAAPIIFGPNANPTYKAHIAKDGEVFKLGEITITALHTPGHTMESTSFLLKDEQGKEHALFSGDTLFLGDVGRPDLAQKAVNKTQEELAGILYHSLRDKIMPLGDAVILYPAHGAGSACGKNLSKETIGTLGQQKQTNYALRADMTQEEFVKEVTDGLLPPPSYFPINVKLNKEGYEDVASIVAKNHPLSPQEFLSLCKEKDALLLDVRSISDFANGHVPGSIFIGLDGAFAPWVGALITDNKQPILIIAPKGREEEAIIRLSRVGYDNSIGYLSGGFDAWKKEGLECDTVPQITATQFATKMEHEPLPVFDLRKPCEFEAAHLEIGSNVPLDFLNEHLANFPSETPFYIHCAGGYRSLIALSILKARGYHKGIDVIGGFNEIEKTTLKTTGSTCSIPLL